MIAIKIRPMILRPAIRIIPVDDPGDPGDGNGGGGTNQNDWIIDGNTPYEEKFDYYYQMAMDKLANNEEIPPELREIIEGYFGILLPNN